MKDRVDYGNGINASADNRMVYVATSLDGDLLTYRTNLNAPGDKQPGKVTLEEDAPRMRLGGHLDNIEWADATRREMIVASHANLATLGLQSFDAPVTAPSRIIRFAIGDGGLPVPASAKLIYANNGDQISAASVAAYFKDKTRERIFIGSIFGEQFLTCKLEAH